MVLHGVFTLCVAIGETGPHREELVLADTAVDDLLGAGRGVELPARSAFYQGEGEGKFLRAEQQDGLVLALEFDPHQFVVGSGEPIPHQFVRNRIAGEDHIGAAGAQNAIDGCDVIRLHGNIQRLDGSFQAGE